MVSIVRPRHREKVRVQQIMLMRKVNMKSIVKGTFKVAVQTILVVLKPRLLSKSSKCFAVFEEVFLIFQTVMQHICTLDYISNASWFNSDGDTVSAEMGGKSSSLMGCEINRPSFPIQSKSSAYIYCYKLPPPSYNHNWTDLHYAASHGNVRRIQEIIHKSGVVNLNKKDYYGKTPLYWAAYKGHKKCMEELIKFGAKVNTQCRHGGTPLHAVVSLYPECALLLIKNGANVNQSDNWGVTPIYLAATSGQLDVIQYLLAAGAELNIRNKNTGEIPKQLESQKSLCDKLLSLSHNPLSLQQLCRITVRRQLGDNPQPKMTELEVPKQIKEYLSLSELG